MPRFVVHAFMLALLTLAAIVPTALAIPTSVGGVPFIVPLTGQAEVPGPGDPDASGTAVLRLNPGREQICYELTVINITPSTGAHIHQGTSAESGPVVVHLTPPDASGFSSGCVEANRELILEIIRNPEQYYVNVHTLPLYGAGAVRGQLA